MPDNSRPQLGGGWTFMKTFRKYAERAGVEFVSSWQDCDVVLVAGVTLVETSEIWEAHVAGKKVIYRVGNVPRKSRNRKNTPSLRMKSLANMADVVVHQSEWSRNYCMPLVGDGPVIYNGADMEIFKAPEKKSERERWLFAYHNKNEIKGFWTAHLMFQLRHRVNPDAEFWFIYDFGKDLEELENARFDFWNGEHFAHIEKQETPEGMAEIMKSCTHFVYPAVWDACPNEVLEARACGLEVVGVASKELAGTQELLDPHLDISAERMVEEYLSLCRLLIHSETL